MLFIHPELAELLYNTGDPRKQTKHATFRIELKGLGGLEVVFCKQRGAGVRGGGGAKDQQWGANATLPKNTALAHSIDTIPYSINADIHVHC